VIAISGTENLKCHFFNLKCTILEEFWFWSQHKVQKIEARILKSEKRIISGA